MLKRRDPRRLSLGPGPASRAQVSPIRIIYLPKITLAAFAETFDYFSSGKAAPDAMSPESMIGFNVGYPAGDDAEKSTENDYVLAARGIPQFNDSGLSLRYRIVIRSFHVSAYPE